MKIIVKHKPGCPKCKFTMNMLKNKGYQFEDVLIHPETDRKAIQELLDDGHQSFPVVYVYSDSGNFLDAWDDLRVDKINKLQYLE